MSRRHFGTDGVRGVANIGLTPELAFQLGQAAGRLLEEADNDRRVVCGRDTRKSGVMLEAALAAGFCSTGADVTSLGIVPTPTVSFVARTGPFGLGAIISASHNPAPDNGIKFVGHDGRKLTDALETRIEELMETPYTARPSGGRIGGYAFDRMSLNAYLDHLAAIVPEGLAGMRVALDGAHGAAFELGPEILSRLGADVIATGVTPNGTNINDEGGATKPHLMQEFTVRNRADVGVAFDGDADRAVFSDEQGRLLNGDRTMGIWAAHYQERGELHPPVVIGTLMSNGGFERYLESRGITLYRAPVGDKYVSQRIEETSAPIGGEQSGHIVFPRRGPTGDGLATMLEFLRVLMISGRPASAFHDAYEAAPQVLVNLEVRDRATWRTPEVDRAIELAEEKLGQCGRVVVRASGTQPVVRVMVEATDRDRRDETTASLIATLEREAGAREKSRTDLTDGLGD
jgi:phosphoglucosamine mutase